MEEASELPQVPQVIGRLFADFETTSGHFQKKSTNPWRDCSTIGVAVAFGFDSPVWFVPKRLLVTGWWRDVVKAANTWTNHNIKYDVHVSHNDLSVTAKCELDCTLNSSKLIDSDRVYKGGYGLDALSKDWCKFNIDQYGTAMLPWLEGNQDYGRIPLDILAEYACVDVVANRKLATYVDETMPMESIGVWRTEREFTSLLVDMERHGVTLDPQKVKIKRLSVLKRLIDIDAELNRIVGYPFRPHVRDDCYDVLVNQFGLPVLGWTNPLRQSEDDEDDEDEGYREPSAPGPSFDKATMKKYLTYPGAPKDLIKLMLEYRQLNTFESLFLSKWLEMADARGVLHATYNQAVRTGRMSCSKPNLQQLSGVAKELIEPPPGYVLVCTDASQIEYRFISHYIHNERIIASYQENPWVDFHDWVANMVPTKRKPAKTLNFMMGYGGGKTKTIEMLSINEDFVGDVIAEVDALGLEGAEREAAIKRATVSRAEGVYKRYHEAMPELKRTSKFASGRCVKNGYVRNHYGRRRHLPEKAAHVAFNSINQSSAGDLVKERMLALRREVPELIQVAQVHDEILGLLPKELVQNDDHYLRKIVGVLNNPNRPLTVPVRWSIGYSEKHWAEAKGDDAERKYFWVSSIYDRLGMPRPQY